MLYYSQGTSPPLFIFSPNNTGNPWPILCVIEHLAQPNVIVTSAKKSLLTERRSQVLKRDEPVTSSIALAKLEPQRLHLWRRSWDEVGVGMEGEEAQNPPESHTAKLSFFGKKHVGFRALSALRLIADDHFKKSNANVARLHWGSALWL